MTDDRSAESAAPPKYWATAGGDFRSSTVSGDSVVVEQPF